MLGSENGSSKHPNALESPTRQLTADTTGLLSLAGGHPIHLGLPESVNQTSLNSLGIEEDLGNNAAVLIRKAEEVSDFVTRVIIGPHTSVNDVVSNARFTNGEVKRYRTSNLLNGGTPEANHDVLQHGAVREIYGIDTVDTV
jgi:hypothetical protein